jgi:predicted Zn-dependent protease
VAISLSARCESLLERAHPGEHLEVFARRVRSTAVRGTAGPGAAPAVRCGDGWLVSVSSRVNGVYGSAVGNLLDEDSLADALADARAARALAPRPAPDDLPAPRADEALERDQPMVAVTDLAGLVRETAGLVHRPADVTGGFTRRTVLRYDSAGWAGRYEQAEAQIHIRSAERGLDGAQGACIRRMPGEIDPRQVVADFNRGYEALARPGAPAGRLDWIALSPLITARLVGRLSRAFLRTRAKSEALVPGTVLGCGRQLLTLVDDGREAASTVGSPFDDEGTARQRTVLLAAGRVEALLGSRAAGPSTGNAAWTDWDQDTAPDCTACFFEPTEPGRQPDFASMPGNGLVAEDLRGFRGGLDLLSARIEFELAGAVLHGGRPAGTGRAEVSAAPGEFLGAFQQIYSETEFYRIRGLRGGSWSLIDGKVAHHDN